MNNLGRGHFAKDRHLLQTEMVLPVSKRSFATCLVRASYMDAINIVKRINMDKYTFMLTVIAKHIICCVQVRSHIFSLIAKR